MDMDEKQMMESIRITLLPRSHPTRPGKRARVRAQRMVPGCVLLACILHLNPSLLQCTLVFNGTCSMSREVDYTKRQLRSAISPSSEVSRT